MLRRSVKLQCWIVTCLAAWCGSAHGQLTIAGNWKTIDDESRTAKALVQITEVAGIFTGRIHKLLPPDSAQDATCEECTDERKNQPIVGMTILRSVRQSSADAGIWDGGDILDPETGKVYRVRLRPLEGGEKLELRGYLGIPLLGRTQTWIRVD
jgi:uncharacterized protein (DUF2147 family)